jgi:hypothetical protein
VAKNEAPGLPSRCVRTIAALFSRSNDEAEFASPRFGHPLDPMLIAASFRLSGSFGTKQGFPECPTFCRMPNSWRVERVMGCHNARYLSKQVSRWLTDMLTGNCLSSHNRHSPTTSTQEYYSWLWHLTCMYINRNGDGSPRDHEGANRKLEFIDMEKRSLLQELMEWGLRVLHFAFGCHHSNLSRVFTIDRRTYRLCCSYGARFKYSLETVSMDAGRTGPLQC